MSDNRNLILALVLSAAIMVGWQYVFGVPKLEQELARQAAEQAAETVTPGAPGETGDVVTGVALSRAEALNQSRPRVTIDTPTVDGSMRLKGARFDDLQLKRYHETVDPKSPEIVILSPLGTDFPYYAEFGWLGLGGGAAALPDSATQWEKKSGTALAPGRPVTLEWDNGQGLVFTRTISVDDKYLFTVTDTVRNTTGAAVSLAPYALVVRHGEPETTQYWVLHEGFVGFMSGRLQEADYSDFEDDPKPRTFKSTGGWLGITDKYWMAAVVPPQDEAFDGAYKSFRSTGGRAAYQADYKLAAREIPAGGTAEVTHRLFAGAKVVSIIEAYEESPGITRFDLAVDWGWFAFLTKPIFLVLDLFYQYLGNFGLAILLLTVVIKLIFFPLANTSYQAMSRMKKLQPEMEKLRERYKDDRVGMQQALMELYKREKVNPVAGCLPVLIQIPVFFSLYKVLFVTIEMRHAPFYGWIEDLAAPDPTSIFNLFGLLPFDLPAFLTVGIWPIVMGVSMWVQMKLNPPPQDPVQAKIFAFMPLIFTFLLATFPAGLVIYWTWNNILSILQQAFIMRRSGVPIELFNNMRVPVWARDAWRRVTAARSKEGSDTRPGS